MAGVAAANSAKSPASDNRFGDEAAADEATLHVTALDALVNVNSIFSGVVFIGLAFSSKSISLVTSGDGDPCNPSSVTGTKVVLFEVLAFAAFLASSLVAQGLKLQLAIICAKKVVLSALVPINERFIRFGMAVTAVCTAVGTMFLMLSIVFVIELRLGSLHCPTSAWSKGAAIPLIISFFFGFFIFLGSVLYAFFV